MYTVKLIECISEWEILIHPKAEFMNVQFCWGFPGKILRVLRLVVSVYNVYINARGREGDYNLILEVTVNSKEENSKDFCPNYVQEFGLCSLTSFIN